MNRCHTVVAALGERHGRGFWTPTAGVHRTTVRVGAVRLSPPPIGGPVTNFVLARRPKSSVFFCGAKGRFWPFSTVVTGRRFGRYWGKEMG
jgi:hypothetical protein